MGLASNVVSSLYRDDRGFMWVGTANGLQRFDGIKFIQFSTRKHGSDELPHTTISQILPAGDGQMILAMPSAREFGLFNPSAYTYKKIEVVTNTELPPRAEFRLWRTAEGDIYCTVSRYGLMKYDSKRNQFVGGVYFPFPKGWLPNLGGIYEDVSKKQIWFATDSGICIYDKPTGQMWSKYNNPKKLRIFYQPQLSDNTTQLYIDKQRRIWVFGWPSWGRGGQYKFCFDSNGNFLNNDTAGINTHSSSYTEYNHLFETDQGHLWIYGTNVLMSYEENIGRFQLHRPSEGGVRAGIDYQVVYQMLDDKDGGVWLATDKGLYHTGYSSSTFSVVNLLFKNHESGNITDVLELPNRDLWFTSWGHGVRTLDSSLKKKENFVYSTPVPRHFPPDKKSATQLTWSMCRQSSSGNIWIGCNGGVLLVHDPESKHTDYLLPKEVANSTIRFLVEDRYGTIWMGTQGGRVVKWQNNRFTVVNEVGTIIYKLFFDSQGWLWLATHEKGLYAINPNTGATLQHYTTETKPFGLYSNTGNDIEQLNDSIIVYGAGGLNFINKRTRAINIVSYENGLPSNTVKRVRMDKKGSLWIITSNGLCRYNPRNQQITPYGRRDGIIVAEQTSDADYFTSTNHLVFAGSNAVLLFNPDVFSTRRPPPDVTLTDFKVLNRFLPIDSLTQRREIRLQHRENSISIYFASLSYSQRDKLSYYYKMEGLDKEWTKADPSLSVNYSLLPPGRYTFKVFCENIEGIRSAGTTELNLHVRPPFWKTWWFTSSLLFVLLLIAYAIHDLRVNRLLAVEKVRNRVARDLHDDMGSTLSTINILSSMAKTKMNADPIKTTEYLSKIGDYSQRMMEAMDDIVWSIKPSNDSMVKIIARMREFATNALEAKEIDMDFTVGEHVNDVKLNMEARRDLFLIFKEAVNNAAKYSKASLVTISLELHKGRLELLVKDNGTGFDIGTADGGNGLGNMQKRADHIGATINLRSTAGEGTSMRLSIHAG